MSKDNRHFFSIDGYFVDDPNNPFEGQIVCDCDDFREEDEDTIFFYGLSEKGIQQAIESKEPVDDFIITAYTQSSI